MRSRLLVVSLLVVAFAVSATAMKIPFLLNHQGRLVDASGKPVTGTFDLSFRIFNAPTSGTLLWEETHTAVVITEGAFSLQLGTLTPLTPDIFGFDVTPGGTNTPSLALNAYLEIEVGLDGPMAPRTQLVSVPYAMLAARVAGDIFTDDGRMVMLDPITRDTTITFKSDLPSGQATGKRTHIVPGGAFLVDATGDTTISFNAKLAEGEIKKRPPDDGSDGARSTQITAGGTFMVDSFFDIAYRIEFNTTDSGSESSMSTSGPNGSNSITQKARHDAAMNSIRNMKAISPNGDTTEIDEVVNTAGASISLRRDNDSDGDGLLDFFVDKDGVSLSMNKAELVNAMASGPVSKASIVTDTSKAQMTLSKADAGKALNAFASSTSAGLVIIDSTLNDSAIIDLRIDNGRTSLRMAEDQANSDGTISKIEFTVLPDRMEFTRVAPPGGTGGGGLQLGLTNNGGGLTVSNIGSSGLDGVSVGGGAGGARIAVTQLAPGATIPTEMVSMSLSGADPTFVLNQLDPVRSVATEILSMSLSGADPTISLNTLPSGTTIPVEMVELSLVSAEPRFALRRLKSGSIIPTEMVALSLRSSDPLIALRSLNDAPSDLPRCDYAYDGLDRLVRTIRSTPLLPGDSSAISADGLLFYDGPVTFDYSIRGMSFSGPAGTPYAVSPFGEIQAQGTSALALDPAANLGVGTLAPSVKLEVFGDICATGTIGACSDVRYKTKIEALPNALDMIGQLRGVEFNWRTDQFPDKRFNESRQVGFIAQEIIEVVPSVVTLGSDGYYSVDYGKLTPLLVEAVKSQQSTIESQKSEIMNLEVRLAKLETVVNNMAKLSSANGKTYAVGADD